ncbi:lytic transglycosylase domain-containing protein [Marinospirillum insulare]|uniref:Lytic transglycosylase n=1 Tax=Marinospirillum insulare TaxID=217169 RepID=A0ABQ5ZZ54_9GAMM|nr:lytic transglycosylase domain-containing protein [Marinospirillum insulare]GLR64781.1 lytic transglycosylase [Marinospirillum insulare]
MSKWNKTLPLLLLLLAVLPATSSTSAFFSRQLPVKQPDLKARQVFSDSYQQLRRGELIDISTTLKKLKNYPLAPYLQQQLFRNQLAYGVIDKQELSNFLAAHPNTAFQQKLQAEWLEELGKTKDWSSFLIETNSNPNPLNSRLSCYQLTAEAKVIGISLQWMDKATDYWRSNQPLPNNCQQLTHQLDQLGLLSTKDYQQAALTLMHKNQPIAARLLQRKLSKADQKWLALWLEARSNPASKLRALTTRRVGFNADSAIKNEVLTHLLKQLANRQPTQTKQIAKQLYKRQQISQKALWQVKEHLAIRTARYSNHSKTLQAFAAIPAEQLSPEGHQAYARTLLRQANWPRLVSAFNAFPQQLLAKNEWRYWQAHALNQTNQAQAAKALLKPLAKKRNYYGFLAAQQLGLQPQMNALDTPLDTNLVNQLRYNPGIARAEELFFTNHPEEARQEWHYTLSKAPVEDQIQAAWLANQWGRYHLSVSAAHNAGLYDAVELRFPLAHLDTLRPLAEQANLDLPLVLALIRKESIFNAQARSRVGALGLMQVMPATGKQVAQRLKLAIQPKADLLKPEYNLPIGVDYLAGLMKRYNNNPVLAAAAYNAGPGKANAWLTSLGKEVDPLWVERITYAETRDYVKSLLAFREVYAWRLAQQETLRQAKINSPNTPKG